MARRKHPNKKDSGLWRPHSGDDFDCTTLKRMLTWFENDLRLAKEYYNNDLKPLVDAGWSPSKGSFADMVRRAKEDIKISQANIITCRQALRENNCQ